MNRTVLIAALALSGLVAGAHAQESEELKPEVVVRVIQSAFPDISAEEIDVKMIKRLTSRVKVNLEIEDRNAILYLTWQRSRTGPRWWFEHDPERSLVYLSKTTGSARDSSARVAANIVAPKTDEPVPETRTETLEVEAEAVREAEPEEPVEEVKSAPEQEAEAQPTEAEKPQPEETDVAAEVEDVVEEAEPVSSVSVSLAVGPTATSRQFLYALVSSIAEGERERYPGFLLRISEVISRVNEEQFSATVDSWILQCQGIHEALEGFDKIEVKQIILQRAQSGKEEKAMLYRLRQMVPTVKEAFTYVKINLLLDGRPAYISIRGLMRIEDGWRIGGRIELVPPENQGAIR